jgi:hypothetical protein
VQRGQIHALRLARQRVAVPRFIANFDLVELRNECHDNSFDAVNIDFVCRYGLLAMLSLSQREAGAPTRKSFEHQALYQVAPRDAIPAPVSLPTLHANHELNDADASLRDGKSVVGVSNSASIASRQSTANPMASCT